MKTRLYAVNVIVEDEGSAFENNYLVDAGNVNGAIRHVAKRHIRAQTADGKTVARLMAAGVKPESAVDDGESNG